MASLNLKRFTQNSSTCAIASCATIANYYNKSIDYEFVKNLAIRKNILIPGSFEGLYTAETSILLNLLGFRKVDIISSDLSYLDYSWKNLSKKNLLQEMKSTKRKIQDDELKSVLGYTISFMKNNFKGYRNNIIIDYRFGNYIREGIDAGIPIVASFDWTAYFEKSKEDERGLYDPSGNSTEHAVAITGYNKSGVKVIDSHYRFYKGKKLKKYQNGKYTIKWEELMTCMGKGDLIVPSNYSADWCQ